MANKYFFSKLALNDEKIMVLSKLTEKQIFPHLPGAKFPKFFFRSQYKSLWKFDLPKFVQNAAKAIFSEFWGALGLDSSPHDHP